MAVLVLVALVPRNAAAQATGATVSGTITDPSGASVPGATITATNTGTGVTRTASTDAKGFYNIVNLQPGTYNLTYAAN
ncbi:MAG: carboxypeptidase-like regulatory domain-containing protein, partial [Terriglobales bacterium]